MDKWYKEGLEAGQEHLTPFRVEESDGSPKHSNAEDHTGILF